MRLGLLLFGLPWSTRHVPGAPPLTLPANTCYHVPVETSVTCTHTLEPPLTLPTNTC